MQFILFGRIKYIKKFYLLTTCCEAEPKLFGLSVARPTPPISNKTIQYQFGKIFPYL